MIAIIINDVFFILLKSGLLLVTISFCSPFYCENFELCVHYVFYEQGHSLGCMVYYTASLSENVRVPLTLKEEFQRSIFEFKYSSAFSIPYLSKILRASSSSIIFFPEK